jgi:hypothetical protein
VPAHDLLEETAANGTAILITGHVLRILRYSEQVAALIPYLTATARRWTAQLELTRVHPGLATIIDTMAALLHAQLDAIDRAGPKPLRATPRPRLITSVRVLAPPPGCVPRRPGHSRP